MHFEMHDHINSSFCVILNKFILFFKDLTLSSKILSFLISLFLIEIIGSINLFVFDKKQTCKLEFEDKID